MTTFLPAWPASGERDNHAMLRWLELRLNEIHDERDYGEWRHGSPFTPAERVAYALQCAEAGDVTLLRDELVSVTGNLEVGRFVNLPKLKKGERWRTGDGASWIARAAADVPRIRKLWLDHYGKKRRKQSDGWSAERFAAEIHKVGADQIERYLKKH